MIEGFDTVYHLDEAVLARMPRRAAATLGWPG